MRGRKAKPTELKVVQGTLNKSRERARGIEQEPQFDHAEDVSPPEYLDGLALRTWNDLAPKLQKATVLKEADLRTLEAYCICYANLRMAQQELDSNGPVLISDDTGKPFKNPAATVVNESLTQLARYSALLGLDPSSRTRINVGKKERDNGNPFERLRRTRKSRD